MPKATFYVALLTCLLLSLSCNEESTAINESSIFTFQLGIANPHIIQTAVDDQKEHLFVALRGGNDYSCTILKINLANAELVKQTRLEYIIPYGFDNIILTSDGGLIASFFNYTPTSNLLIKFDADLNEVKRDSTSNESYFGRVSMFRSASGEIQTVEANKDTSGVPFIRYALMDENLNRTEIVKDTSSAYSPVIFVGAEYFQTSDGGHLYTALVLSPSFSFDGLVEKRDANYNLLWRRVLPNAQPWALVELNGKYYHYATDRNATYPFITILSSDGNIIDKVDIANNGFTTASGENVIVNEKNELMLLAKTTETSRNANYRGALFIADENVAIKNQSLFGSTRAVASATLKSIANNQHLILYIDYGYKADETEGRLVLEFVDSEGNLTQ